MRFALPLVAALALVVNGGASLPIVENPPERPIVIAHRGASGERPEHTLAAYDLAIDQGADFIEPDLVPTKDDVLVARHENEIGGTTDVAAHPEFAARRATRTIDGEQVTGWFTEDFTLAELKTLRARERLPRLRPGNIAHDGHYEIPTLAEIIALAKRRSAETGRTIGIYPETKHPTYFAGIGHPTDARLVAELHAAGWDSAAAPVFIQSFEVDNLRRLGTITHIRLIQLLAGSGAPADGAQPSYAAMTTPDGLKAVARYAHGIGPDKAMLWTGNTPSALAADAHRAGLKVHPWTYRAEEPFLPAPYKGRAGRAGVRAEIRAALDQKIDGFFTDFPVDGVQVRDGAP
ncbi:glycerophosphodiester phosphodiesterase [Sphingomonas sp.]|jgi:glycerophosphoryl diester phosphodiesterase|uniref:glycerophosphodiester phosphodiesterase n=1 Tax=Sphingomonas sp. TaxID=28214 RepID=UPI002D7EAE74|nr:glycerophosphodiester phosphodiesterase [Sphingomonas sp.]HEU0043157.1 glycerophosphodiester phosphodiesterase [Sphingomonas sp.]